MFRPRQIYAPPSTPVHTPVDHTAVPTSKIFTPPPQRHPLYMDDLYDLMSVDRVCATTPDCQQLLREYVGHNASRFVVSECVNHACRFTYHPGGNAPQSYKHPLYSTQKK